MPRSSMNAPKFEGWHYDAFAGVVPRRRVHGRDLEKTLSTSIVTSESIDSILSSHIHFPSATSTIPSQLLLSLSPCRIWHNTPSSYDDSSIDDVLSSSSAFPLPTGIGLGILRLTRKEGGDPFDGLGLVHIHRSSRDPSSDGDISNTILREDALTFLQPSICFEMDDSGDSEPEKTKPVDMPSPSYRSLPRNFCSTQRPWRL
ncbi:hypothetical protein ARMSODRAFT_724961 [Armillaria solidipes]|uniref:Uncharacterized protein n=1 Tax=Armillaria solidipes TaxID=1076256 RepID=A0A2H3ANX7_9AGAR|nr:hypothetical protein ARMSODRAFT_724961 [Armillaria solidipes]